MPYKDIKVQREYQRIWMAKRRADWLATNGPCVDCRSWEFLEIDHQDPQQKVSHRVWSWSEVRRTEELDKCVVRCASCHNTKTIANHELARGERNGHSKLTETQVRQLREAKLNGENIAKIAREMGVSRSSAHDAAVVKTWRHVRDVGK